MTVVRHLLQKKFAVSLPVFADLLLMPAGVLSNMAKFLLLKLLLLLETRTILKFSFFIFHCSWCTETCLSYLRGCFCRSQCLHTLLTAIYYHNICAIDIAMKLSDRRRVSSVHVQIVGGLSCSSFL